ncbi:hypothetical protein AMS68_005729 [Peltaster fructicola]|uniref:Cell division control protein 73 C-terminal domain-containing protein n=1 Tax=Peltaster fructicola TaxID=286661 RepID=A0A6H0XZK9_9PEZI|nr:hypothetical protein AMS68_005729 [Peltaster fructicola]
MATADGLPPDALSLLRAAVASSRPPILTTSADATAASDTTESLAEATHLAFNPQSITQDGTQHISIPLTQSTRFLSGGSKPVDLRTVYFYHINRNISAPEYISLATALNSELQKLGRQETLENLPFQERVALQSWLDGEGGEEGNEFIRSAEYNQATRSEARDAAAVAQGGEDVEMRDVGLSDAAVRKKEEERLKIIYSLERKMGDRNTVLRGHKMQDFSGIRKYSAAFLVKAKPSAPTATQPSTVPSIRPAIKPASNRRVEPIILLSPSASSLIRMSNAKSFLQDGLYSVPEPGSTSNLLQLTRTLPSIDDKRALRFILVDSPDNFRPDYWSRVVAVFTTGQSWQFKNYKWQTPADLFSHVLGVYVGWKGDGVPDTVKGWGRGVLSVGLDKGSSRWRDREIVEEVWSGIEARMKAMGWNREGPRA